MTTRDFGPRHGLNHRRVEQWPSWFSLALSVVFFAIPQIVFGQFSVETQSDRVDVTRDGELVTSYLFRSGSKPVLWPILGPDRQAMTRNYPIDPSISGEEHDHPHHRGLWLTFGEVNDMDWWAEGPGKGVVEHRRLVEATALPGTANLVVEHVWMSPEVSDGPPPQPVLNATCRYEISGDKDETIIDCEAVVRGADPEKSVHFGDTKEGMFAIRVPESMRGDRPDGTLRNSVGDVGGDVWGKSAHWVDYSGPTIAGDSRIYGIGILVHPTSFRSEGLWHARTYGLFAHNPFGIKDFIPNRTQTLSGKVNPPHEGGYVLPRGDALHFFYRVIFHRDRWNQEIGDQRWEEFTKTAQLLH